MKHSYRISLLVNHWYQIGIENGYYLKDIAFENLDGNEQKRLYQMAHHHVVHSTLLPLRREDGWVWLDVEKSDMST